MSSSTLSRRKHNWIALLGTSWHIIVCSLLLICLCKSSVAQDYSQAIGVPTFTSAEPVELGIINAGNGNLHMEIPIASFPQRGAKPLTYKLVYDSRIWQINGGTTWDPSPGGWRFITSADVGTVGSKTWTTVCDGGTKGDSGENNFSWTSPDGTPHFFDLTLQYSNNCGGAVQRCSANSAMDDSGYFMIENTDPSCEAPGQNMGLTVLAPDGSQVQSQSGTGTGFKDSNGNYYSIGSNGGVVDTLGRTPVIVNTSCGTNQTCYTVLNSQGGTSRSTWTVTTESIPVHTAFGDPYQPGV